MSRLSDLRNAGRGLYWLLGGHHGGLRELPDRLGYLRDLESAHLAMCRELASERAQRGIFERALAAANARREGEAQAREDLGRLAERLRTERDEARREADSKDEALKELGALRLQAAGLREQADSEARRKALLDAPAGTPCAPVLYPSKGKGQR